MTNTEFRDAQDQIQAEIRAAQTRLMELQKAFKKTAPFQPGDKVLVKYLEKGKAAQTTFFIAEVKLPYFYRKSEPESAKFSYEFSKVKKDGTKHANNVYISGATSIEKI